MRTTIIKTGNDYSINIPPTLLVACDMDNEVELLVDNKRLIIAAYKKPRHGWFTEFKAQEAETDAFEGLPVDEGDDDWVW